MNPTKNLDIGYFEEKTKGLLISIAITAFLIRVSRMSHGEISLWYSCRSNVAINMTLNSHPRFEEFAGLLLNLGICQQYHGILGSTLLQSGVANLNEVKDKMRD